MSEDQKIGEASVEAAQGYTSMSDAYAPPEEPRKIYNSEEGGIREAAEDLSATRAKAEDEPTPRTYVEIGGDHHGEAVPENQTLSLERGSDDLTRQRALSRRPSNPTPPKLRTPSISSAHRPRSSPGPKRKRNRSSPTSRS